MFFYRGLPEAFQLIMLSWACTCFQYILSHNKGKKLQHVSSVPSTPYVDHLSLHINASLTTPLGPKFRTLVLPSPKTSIFVSMSMQIDTSTQLDLPPTIPRGRRGPRRLRLLPPPPPLFLAPVPSQTSVLHVSHAVHAIVREERPKMKRVPVTHRFSPYGDV